MNKLVIENFTGGIATSKYYGENTYQQGVGIDPFYAEENLGDVNPGLLGTQKGSGVVTTVIGDFALVDSATGSASNVIYGYSATKIYEIAASNFTFTNNATYPLTITNGTARKGILYFKDRLLYCNGSTQVGIFTPGGTPSQTDNQFTGFTSDTTSRPMCEGFNTAYIANGANIASITDPTNAATLNLTALDLPSNTMISDMLFFKDTLVIATYTGTISGTNIINNRATLYFWDGFSESWYAEVKLPEATIFNLRIYEGNIIAQGASYLYTVNSSGFQPLLYIGSTRTATNLRPAGTSGKIGSSMTVFKNSLFYINSDGNLVAYGSPIPSQNKKISIPFKAPTADQEGAIVSTSSVIGISLNDSTFYTYGVDSNLETSVTLSTKEFVFDSPVLITGMRINFQRLGSADDLTVNCINASDGSSTQMGTLTFSSDGGSITSKFLLPSGDIKVSACHFNFVFNAGSVYLKPKITIYYEPIEEPIHESV